MRIHILILGFKELTVPVSCGVVPPLSIRGRVKGTNFKRSPFLLTAGVPPVNVL